MRTKPPHIRLVDAPETATATPAEDHWASLVRRAQAGDVDAFERLASGHYPAVYAFAVSLCGDPTEGADIAQEALIKAFRKLGSYRFAASFKAWLLQVTRNTCRDRMRAQQQQRLKVQRLAAASPAPGTTTPEQQLASRQTRDLIYAALAEVDPRYAEVVVLFDIQGFAYREIAEICNVPMGTVKSRLKRGRDALREQLVASGLLGRRGAGGPGGSGGAQS